MKFFFIFWILISAEAYDELDLKFLNEFTTNHYFHTRFLNVIICGEPNDFNLIKILSESFQRFVTLHRENKALEQILEEPQSFILDLQCSLAREILQQAEQLKLFGKPYQWILMAKDTGIKQSNSNISDSFDNWYWNLLENLSVFLDSDVKIVERLESGKIVVTGAYKISKEKYLIKESLAEWTTEKGLDVLNGKTVGFRRLNLQGSIIPSSLVVTDPNTLDHLDDLVDRHIDTTSKVSYNVVRLFDSMLNSRVTYKIVDAWGVLENGTWTGMLGDIQRGISEIGAAPLFLQKQRMDVIEYYAMVNPTGTKFIFLSPPLSYSNNIFIMPFDTIVWCCCLGMVAVSCFLLFTALSLESDSGSNVKEEKITVSFTEILVLNIGAICLQGTVAQTKGPAARIITLFLYLSYMFLYISYSASIVAILQSSDTSIQTLADILNSPLKAGADDIAYSQYYFKTADDDVRKAIYRLKIAPKGEKPHFLPVEEGIKEVRKGLYAYHTEASAGYQIIQKTFTEEEKCGLQETRNSFLKAVDPWLIMKKRTPYAEVLKIGIKRIIETGFKSRSVRRYYSKKPVCAAKGSRFVSVGIYDCYYAFMLLMCGTSLSVCIMIMEVSVNKYLKRRRNQETNKNENYLPGDIYVD